MSNSCKTKNVKMMTPEQAVNWFQQLPVFKQL